MSSLRWWKRRCRRRFVFSFEIPPSKLKICTECDLGKDNGAPNSGCTKDCKKVGYFREYWLFLDKFPVPKHISVNAYNTLLSRNDADYLWPSVPCLRWRESRSAWDMRSWTVEWDAEFRLFCELYLVWMPCVNYCHLSVSAAWGEIQKPLQLRPSAKYANCVLFQYSSMWERPIRSR